jgi:hypothetical protein
MTDTIHRTTDNSTPALVVYDGQTKLGRILRHGNSFEALDVDGASHGVFPTMKDAAFALPTRSAP